MSSPLSLSSLSLPSSTLSALSTANLTSPSQILSLSPSALSRKTSLPSQSQSHLYHQLHSTFSPRAIPPPPHLPTLPLTPNLNTLLRGGLPPYSVIQLAGASNTAKTQTAFTIAANALISRHGVIWLDTSCISAVHTRIHSILHARHVTPEDIATIADALLVLPASSHDQAIHALHTIRRDSELLETVAHESVGVACAISAVRVLVFDSIASVVAPMLGLKTDDGWNGHVGMSEIARALRWFAWKGVCVVVTNRVVRDGRGMHPALGRFWEAFVDVDIMTEQVEKDVTCVKVVSKRGRGGESRIRVTEQGVVDA